MKTRGWNHVELKISSLISSEYPALFRIFVNLRLAFSEPLRTLSDLEIDGFSQVRFPGVAPRSRAIRKLLVSSCGFKLTRYLAERSCDMVALGATLDDVTSDAEKSMRAFKTAWFAKAVRKAHIPEEELCTCHPANDVGAGRRSRRRRFQEAPTEKSVPSIILARAGHGL